MRSITVPVSFAVAIAACGGMEDPSTLPAENTESIQVHDDLPPQSRLLTTLSLDNGNTLEFYEASPGAVFISEVGRVRNPPVSLTHDLRSMSLVEIHQTFAPGQVMPATLTAAQDRLNAHKALDQDVTVLEPVVNDDYVAMNNDVNQDDDFVHQTRQGIHKGNPLRWGGWDGSGCPRDFDRYFCNRRLRHKCVREWPRYFHFDVADRAKKVQAAVCALDGTSNLTMRVWSSDSGRFLGINGTDIVKGYYAVITAQGPFMSAVIGGGDESWNVHSNVFAIATEYRK